MVGIFHQNCISLDEEFLLLMGEVEASLQSYPHPRQITIRVKAWQQRLTQVCTNRVFQKMRNLHCGLLLYCLQTGDWNYPPVNRVPKHHGPLESLAPHIICMVKQRVGVDEDEATGIRIVANLNGSVYSANTANTSAENLGGAFTYGGSSGSNCRATYAGNKVSYSGNTASNLRPLKSSRMTAPSGLLPASLAGQAMEVSSMHRDASLDSTSLSPVASALKIQQQFLSGLRGKSPPPQETYVQRPHSSKASNSSGAYLDEQFDKACGGGPPSKRVYNPSRSPTRSDGPETYLTKRGMTTASILALHRKASGKPSRPSSRDSRVTNVENIGRSPTDYGPPSSADDIRRTVHDRLTERINQTVNVNVEEERMSELLPAERAAAARAEDIARNQRFASPGQRMTKQPPMTFRSAHSVKPPQAFPDHRSPTRSTHEDLNSQGRWPGTTKPETVHHTHFHHHDNAKIAQLQKVVREVTAENKRLRRELRQVQAREERMKKTLSYKDQVFYNEPRELPEHSSIYKAVMEEVPLNKSSPAKADASGIDPQIDKMITYNSHVPDAMPDLQSDTFLQYLDEFQFKTKSLLESKASSKESAFCEQTKTENFNASELVELIDKSMKN